MIPYLISLFIALGVYFLGKFIGKRFTNFHEFSYLGFAIISFILAAILHADVQNTILKTFINCPFIDRRTIILLAVILGLICILIILRIENERKGSVMNDLSSWIYFNRLMERWGKDAGELHRMILDTELMEKRHVDYTDYASSQATPHIIPVENIEAEFDIIDDRLCFKRKDIEKFEKKYIKVTIT